MAGWTLTTHDTRNGLVATPHATEAAAFKAFAELVDVAPAGATFGTRGAGTTVAISPTHELEALPTDATDADERAHVIATGLRANGWWVKVAATDEAGVRTVRLYAYRGKHENGGTITLTSALATPRRSRLARCYQSTAAGTIAMGTLRSVLVWATRAAADYRPASREVTERDATRTYVDHDATAPAAEALELFPAPAEVAAVVNATAQALEVEAAPVVIVACGAAKLDHPAPAGEMYTGSYHRATRRAAAVLAGDAGRVMILSAEYGLLDLDTVIAPYEKRLPERQVPAEWVAMVRAQAAAAGIATAPVVLAGRAYVHGARQIWADAVAPLEGTRGIGDQLARLAEIYRPAEAAAAAPLAGDLHPHRGGAALDVEGPHLAMHDHVEVVAVQHEDLADHGRPRGDDVPHSDGGHARLVDGMGVQRHRARRAHTAASARHRATASHAARRETSGGNSAAMRNHSSSVKREGSSKNGAGVMATTPGVAARMSPAARNRSRESRRSWFDRKRSYTSAWSCSLNARAVAIMPALAVSTRSPLCSPHRIRPAGSRASGVNG